MKRNPQLTTMEPILGNSEFRVKDLDKEYGFGPPSTAPFPQPWPPPPLPCSSSADSGGDHGASAAAAPEAAEAHLQAETGPADAPHPRAAGAHAAATRVAASRAGNLGWLLRLFKSDFFDAWMAVTYLYKYRGNPGVQDYLCNELYSLSDVDLETYLPQICNLLLYHAKDCMGLERFVLDKCADSVHLALQVYWFMEAAVADAIAAGKRDVETHCRLLRARCESAAINGGKHSILMFARRNARSATPHPVPHTPATTNTPAAAAAVTTAAIATPGSERPTPASASQHDHDRLVHDTDPLQIGQDTPSSAPIHFSRSGADGRVRDLLRSRSQPEQLQSTAAHVTHPHDQHEKVRESDSQRDAVDEEFGEFVSADLPPQPTEPVLETKQEDPQPPATRPVQPIQPVDSEGAEKVSEVAEEIDDIDHADPSILVTVKQERFSYFDDTLMLVKKWVKFSLEIRELPLEQRPPVLTSKLTSLNEVLFRRMAGPDHEGEVVPEVLAANGEFSFLRSVHLPLVRANDRVLRVLRINPDETVILNTKTKAPYMLFIEVVETKMFCNNQGIFAEHFFAEDYILERKEQTEKDARAKELNEGEASLTKETVVVPLSPGSQFIAKMQNTHRSADPHSRLQQNVKSVIYGDPEHVSFGERLIGFEAIHEDHSDEAKALSDATIAAVYGELWKDRQDRILKASPFGVIPETKLMAFIVKAGDDLRQEQLAIQLIAQFKRIFDEEKVDVYLRAYTIMCSNAESGLVECLADATSLHSLKKKTPNFLSIRDYYERAFGPVNSIRFQQAQKGFIESMAGYSLVSYFLQILDRHNGNIMLDASGRVIHIDFGFMLGNSPGAVRFESAPFKLTEEYIEVMATRNDQGFNYFKELMVLGFLAARKHHEKICTLVEVMMEGTSMPCMAGGQQVAEELRNRFMLGLPESECIQRVLGLIDESYANWRSKQYDRFQYMTNGIL